MQWFYAAFNAVIVGGPLLGCWLWFRGAWQLRRRMLLAWMTVSLCWIILDVLSVARGWWDYNADYISGVRLAGLPLEEIAFFITVPLACMLTFYALHTGIRGRVGRRAAQRMLWVFAGAVILFTLAAGAKERTAVDCALVLLTVGLLYRSSLILTRSFWVWNGAILLLCLVFNTMLTALPVVVYDQSFMSGIRVGTIPIEDFLYNFSLLNLTALIVRPDIVLQRQEDRAQSKTAHISPAQIQK